MEYLTALREFHRTTGSNTQTMKVGDIVLIHDDTIRVQWKLAIIEGVNKEADGFICSATVRTSTGRTNQPIVKLYPLEVTAAELSNLHNITQEKSTTPTPQPQRGRAPHRAALQGRQKV